MKSIDIKFDKDQIALLQKCLNKKFIKYKSDPFNFTNTVYNKIGIFIDDETYQIRNELEEQDYFGITEDVAKFIFETIDRTLIKSGLENIDINSKVHIIVDIVISEHNIVIKLNIVQ